MSSSPETGARRPVHERAVEGLGTVTVVPVDPGGDAALIHRWVDDERARFWGMTGTTVEDVRAIYAHMDGLTTHHAFLVHRDGEPVALFQTYEPTEDRVSLCYEAEPGDIGIHLLVAAADGPARPGFTGRLLSALVDCALADPDRRRIVVEPDARNEKAIARFARSGFVLGPEILLPEIDLPDVHLPEKRARLAFLRREDRAA
ncbi:GNAT family N-acetyltransferase [Streptomyces sp. GC420]|uniref:GNAT family N-acetyltransferase n=1 Tax=Streptomyces sp. GC420 TaxID=2697568 RepID=UPI001414E23C|nr:GNAT family N-acetyltransferase [Streptomyces sp. GC420]NBM15991.1 GNAT family N-acetyltransferase [Streptomyces sp. GC420]